MAAELYKEADARGVTKKPHRLLPVLFPALFDDKVTAELPKYLPVLAKVSERFRVAVWSPPREHCAAVA